MTNQIIRISYNGPFSQLVTAPTNQSITVRGLYAEATANITYENRPCSNQVDNNNHEE